MGDLSNVSEGGVLHLEIRPGRTFTATVFVTDDAGAPVALDAWSGKAEVRRHDGALLLALTVVVSQATTGPTVGSVTVSATANETKALTDDGRYDLTLYKSGPPLVTRVVREGEVVRDVMATALP